MQLRPDGGDAKLALEQRRCQGGADSRMELLGGLLDASKLACGFRNVTWLGIYPARVRRQNPWSLTDSRRSERARSA